MNLGGILSGAIVEGLDLVFCGIFILIFRESFLRFFVKIFLWFLFLRIHKVNFVCLIRVSLWLTFFEGGGGERGGGGILLVIVFGWWFFCGIFQVFYDFFCCWLISQNKKYMAPHYRTHWPWSNLSVHEVHSFFIMYLYGQKLSASVCKGHIFL